MVPKSSRSDVWVKSYTSSKVPKIKIQNGLPSDTKVGSSKFLHQNTFCEVLFKKKRKKKDLPPPKQVYMRLQFIIYHFSIESPKTILG